jgi:hypothetical protein
MWVCGEQSLLAHTINFLGKRCSDAGITSLILPKVAMFVAILAEIRVLIS